MIKFAEASRRRLPTLLIVLMVLQPLLDIASYFWSLGGHSNLPTLLLRTVCLLHQPPEAGLSDCRRGMRRLLGCAYGGLLSGRLSGSLY